MNALSNHSPHVEVNSDRFEDEKKLNLSDNKSIKKELSSEDVKKIANSILSKCPLSNPFPLKFNVNKKEVEEETLRWITKFTLIPEKLLEKFKKNLFFDLIAGAYPNCQLEKLSIIAEWIIFLYLYDDAAEKKTLASLKPLNQRNLKILKLQSKPTTNDDCFTHALYDLSLRIEKVGAKTFWKKRFVDAVEEYMDGIEWEAKLRKKGKIPKLKIYVIKRLKTSGVYTVLPLIEFANDTNIPNHIFDKYCKNLSLKCNNIVWCSNDIKSCSKDVEENFKINLVFLIQKNSHCFLEESFKRSIEIHNKEVNCFESKKDKLYKKMEKGDLQLYNDDLTNYVGGLGFWMGSHYEFYKNSPRHN